MIEDRIEMLRQMSKTPPSDTSQVDEYQINYLSHLNNETTEPLRERIEQDDRDEPLREKLNYVPNYVPTWEYIPKKNRVRYLNLDTVDGGVLPRMFPEEEEEIELNSIKVRDNFIDQSITDLIFGKDKLAKSETCAEENPASIHQESLCGIRKKDVAAHEEARLHFKRKNRLDICNPVPFERFQQADKEYHEKKTRERKANLKMFEAFEMDSHEEAENLGLIPYPRSFLANENTEIDCENPTIPTLPSEVSAEQVNINMIQRPPLPEKEKAEVIFYKLGYKGKDVVTNVDEWSILSTEVNYVSNEVQTENLCYLHNSPKNAAKEFYVDRQMEEPEIAREEDRQYEGVKSSIEIVDKDATVNCRKSVSITHLGNEKTGIDDKIICIPFNLECRTSGTLHDGTSCDVLIDTGASVSMISEHFYNRTKILQVLPKLKQEKTIKVKVADGDEYDVSFVIQFVVTIGKELFQILALVVPITQTLDIVIGFKSILELEASVEAARGQLTFRSRSAMCICKSDILLYPGEQGDIMVDADTNQIINGQVVFKQIFEDGTVSTKQVHFKNSRTIMRLINNSKNTVEYKVGAHMGVIDLRSIGYFHVRFAQMRNWMDDKFEIESLQSLIDVLKNTNDLDTFVRNKDDSDVDDSNDDDKAEDPYPWLEPDDERRNKTDSELIRELISLDDTILSEKGKEKFYLMLEKYRDAFSLRDEIGLCPSLTVRLQLTDTTPFFIRPYAVKPGEREFVDKEIKRLEHLGVLKQGLSGYTSPIMLIPRKNSKIPRIVTDFRHLNTRLVRLNVAFPLVRDVIQELGDAKPEVVSVVDLRDAYHTLRLHELSKPYCGIIPYYGSDSYLYQRLGMGLAVSPAIWQTFINYILGEITERNHHVAIMDDCLVHSNKQFHAKHLGALFQALINQGLKISPRKCQFFKNNISYMGSKMEITKEGITITPLRTRIEAIAKLLPPTNIRECRMICGVVNYVAMFLPYVRQVLKPIYQLTRKGVPFVWTDMHQEAFDQIKHNLCKQPVLYLPNSTDRFQLYSDTSQLATGAALAQIQEGQPRLVGYASKSLPEAAKNYSITELEMDGLVKNITSFHHYLARCEFDVIVDHSAIPYIMKSNHEPPTTRIKKFVMKLSNYAFRIYYMKGKDMVLSDFLSRYPTKEEPSKTIEPITWIIHEPLTSDLTRVREKYDHDSEQDMDMESDSEHCNIMTRSRARQEGITLPDVGSVPLPGIKRPRRQYHVPDSTLDTDQLPPSIQDVGTVDQDIPNQIPTRILDAGSNDDDLPNIPPPRPRVRFKDLVQGMDNVIPGENRNDPVIPQGLLQQYEQHPQVRPNLDISRQVINAPMPTGVDNPDIVPPDDRLYTRDTLKITLDDGILKYLPKQDTINRLLKKIEHRHVIDTKLPLTLKELQNAYLNSPQLKDLYKYIQTGHVPQGKHRWRAIKYRVEDFCIISGVLFNIQFNKSGQLQTRLAIPEQYVDLLLHVYHDSLLGGHLGTSKTYLTIKEKFFVPRLFELVRLYKGACQVCQLTANPQANNRAFMPRIPSEYMPMAFVSCDIKYMPRTKDGFEYMLVFTCEITGYVVAVPLKQRTGEYIAEAVLRHIVWQFGPPQMLIFDEERAMSSDIMIKLYRYLDVTPKLISPYNHGSLKTERYIKSISQMLLKYLTGKGDQWPGLLQPICFTHNVFVNPNTGFSPFELVYARKPPAVGLLNLSPLENITTTYKDYHQSLISRFNTVGKMVMDQRIQQQAMQNQCRPVEGFQQGQLVYLISPNTSHLITNRSKFHVKYVGPLAIAHVIDTHHYVLMDIEGNLLNGVYHYMRLKPAKARTPKGNISTLAELKTYGYLAPINSRSRPMIDLPENLTQQTHKRLSSG